MDGEKISRKFAFWPAAARFSWVFAKTGGSVTRPHEENEHRRRQSDPEENAPGKLLREYRKQQRPILISFSRRARVDDRQSFAA
jgi:hypothetical protein